MRSHFRVSKRLSLFRFPASVEPINSTALPVLFLLSITNFSFVSVSSTSIFTMNPGFVPSTPLPVRSTASTSVCKTKMSAAEETIDKYYPTYLRYKAPEIKIIPNEGVSMAMSTVEAFETVDKNTEPLLDYTNDDVFIPNIPVPPSAISWPSGDGRGKECDGTVGSFNQGDLRFYGPFPDFFKVCYRIVSFFLLSVRFANVVAACF